MKDVLEPAENALVLEKLRNMSNPTNAHGDVMERISRDNVVVNVLQPPRKLVVFGEERNSFCPRNTGRNKEFVANTSAVSDSSDALKERNASSERTLAALRRDHLVYRISVPHGVLVTLLHSLQRLTLFNVQAI